MIIHLNKSVSPQQAEALAVKHQSILLNDGKLTLITSGKLKTVDDELKAVAEEIFLTDSDIQLASKQYIKTKREVNLGSATIGGATNNCIAITGPCSVESEEQIEAAAKLCVELGVKVLRAGAFKPRTSPYTFQGLGLEGLKLLAKMRDKYGLQIITEVRDSTHADDVIEYA
ncbi:MAG: 3-deoxy-7-phosphoheptulonate synthase, partial [Bacteroidetes bacterium]|nr:3-deoxy-7-phosphoheptulonate synthase [Bacteroidota bacterium]